jgi:glycerol-3-phosphate dehydrogenase
VSRSVLPVPARPRPEWRRLTGERHELLVVGGGIHGAGVARDAALRGLRVAVIERDDWASGTSSRSSKLFHGGLRYLRRGELGMVREALRERDLHLRLAPGLVRPLGFRVPPSPPGATPRWMVRAGIALYGLLSGHPGGGRFWEGEPVYSDAVTDDARFCLEVVLDARRHGALALSYVEWLEWVRRGERIVGARVRDRLSGREGTVTAELCLNAAGPWAEIVGGWARGSTRTLRLTRGTHLVLDRRPDDDARLFFSADDGRVLFLLPYGERGSLLGTTDLDEAVPTRDPVPREEEVRYLCRAFHAQFPEWRGWRAVGFQCGIRPLLAGPGDPSDLSREERVVSDPAGGLVSILGGKYTTYRAVAERAVDRVEATLGREPAGHPTRTVPIPASESGDDPALIRGAFAQEDAVRLEDVFFRRSHRGHFGPVDPVLVRLAGKLWRVRWGLGERETEAEIEAFRDLENRRSAPLAFWEP